MTFDKNKIMEHLKNNYSYTSFINKNCGVMISRYSSLYTGANEYKLKIFKKITVGEEKGHFKNVLETKYVQDIEKIFVALEIVDFD